MRRTSYTAAMETERLVMVDQLFEDVVSLLKISENASLHHKMNLIVNWGCQFMYTKLIWFEL
jgi:hypothetical protein